MNVHQLKGKTVAFAASGGLDSCTVTRFLTNHGVKVVCCTADLAQPDERNVDEIKGRMIACGAIDAVVVDAREALAQAGLEVLQVQAWYEGRYWNTTAIARYVTTKAIVDEMKKRSLTVLSHGATGRGNDQVRFQLATNMLEPSFEVYAPWRDQEFISAFGGRAEMIDFCEKHKLPIRASRQSPYSTDANMLGLTHEAGKLESLETPPQFITPGMGVHAERAPDAPEQVTITFERGVPIAINGKATSILQAILESNRIAGVHGVGIATHLVENRFVGIKSRGVYEAPGMELLGSAYALLLELILDRRAREFFDPLSRLVAKQIYQGYYYDLCTQMALASVKKVAELVTGEITVRLYKGAVTFAGCKGVKHSLYSEETASMEKVGSYDHGDSEGLLRVLGVSARALRTVGQIGEG